MLEACDALGVYMMDETWDMWYHHKTKEDYAKWFMEHYKEDIRSTERKLLCMGNLNVQQFQSRC